MNHLSQEEFVLSYYGEPELGAARRQHLQACPACREELTALAAVLDRVTPLDVPEPDADYEARVWSRLQWRLRGETRRRAGWVKWVAVAATLALAFFAGMLWKSSRRPLAEAPRIATATTGTTAPAAAGATPRKVEDSTRILLVVVGEHFDESERVLVELTNLTPDGSTDFTAPRERAQELLASNRLYRSSATDRGEEDVATLLDELEPILLQIAHAPAEVSAEELRALQKRVETKGLVFKLRVVRDEVQRDSVRPAPATNI